MLIVDVDIITWEGQSNWMQIKPSQIPCKYLITKFAASEEGSFKRSLGFESPWKQSEEVFLAGLSTSSKGA